MRRLPILAAAALLTLTSGASAQTAGGLGALLGGGGLPNLSGAGVGNVTGLLSYCVRNQLLGGASGAGGASDLLGGLAGTRTPRATPTPAQGAQTGAQGVLGRLLGRRDVAGSPGFDAGQAGKLQLGGGRTLPVGNLQDQVKSRLCSAVLSRARAFL